MSSSPRDDFLFNSVMESPRHGTQVTLTRTEGQLFRERVGFVLLCIIGVYCMMRILVELKSVLEPFLWALFLVMALKPLVDSLEKRVEVALNLGFFWFTHKKTDGDNISARSRSRELNNMADDDDSGEMERMLPPEALESATMGKNSVSPVRDDINFVSSRARFGDVDGNFTDDVSMDSRATWKKQFARTFAVLIVFGLSMAVLSGFGFLILESARHMKNHWDVYQKGAQNLTSQTLGGLGYLFQKMPEHMKKRYEDLTADVLKTAQDFIYGFLGEFLNNVSSLIVFVLMTMLYTLFWLCSPVPLNASVDGMFRRYILFKTLACFGFGVCVGTLLALLSIDLASVFALTTFALSFVPEVGPFLAMVLPCPIILLDSRLDRPGLTLIMALIGQLGLKFAFGYFIEVKLIESDKKLRMHPVMILVSVGIFGYLWGPTGMLLSVPLMALLKISLFSDLVPASYRDPILVLLEGDRNAPYRHELQAPSLRAAPGG